MGALGAPLLVAAEAKSEVAELALLRKDLNDWIEQVTNGAASQKAITRQSRLQTVAITGLRSALGHGRRGRWFG